MREVAVIFDMDGLLLDSERLMMEQFRRAVTGMGLPYERAVYLRTLGVGPDETLDVFAGAYGGRARALEIMKRFSELTEEEVRLHGVPVRPGAPQLLAFLKERGCRLALASSNRRKHIVPELRGAGLLDAFETIVCVDDVQRAKPDPELYIRAFAALNAPHAAGYAVEDAPAGVRSAHGAGLMPILVPDLQQPDDDIRALAHRIFPSLADVQAYFASIL